MAPSRKTSRKEGLDTGLVRTKSNINNKLEDKQKKKPRTVLSSTMIRTNKQR